MFDKSLLRNSGLPCTEVPGSTWHSLNLGIFILLICSVSYAGFDWSFLKLAWIIKVLFWVFFIKTLSFISFVNTGIKAEYIYVYSLLPEICNKIWFPEIFATIYIVFYFYFLGLLFYICVGLYKPLICMLAKKSSTVLKMTIIRFRWENPRLTLQSPGSRGGVCTKTQGLWGCQIHDLTFTSQYLYEINDHWGLLQF